MKVGDLVRCVDAEGGWADGPSGLGIIIQVEEYDPGSLSICVQWTSGFLWYEEEDLETISDL
tara:strand:- start:809 stop:994 length:186 start_codon:yes stop_codon:yes gene_type:complete